MRPSRLIAAALFAALPALGLLAVARAPGEAKAQGVVFSGDAAAQWRTIRTKHYEVHTDLDRPLADDLGRRLDAMFQEYANRLSGFGPVDSQEQPLQVYLYQSKAGYAELTGNRFPNTGGVYMAGRNVLAAFLEGQGRDALRRTLQHEAFHQFALTAISHELPVWLNEGMAQYFEEGIWTGRGFLVGQVPPRRLRQLHEDIRQGRLVPFREMLSLTLDEWNSTLADDAERGATHYNQAWAMTHFLVHGKSAAGESYRKRLIDMLKLIHGGKPGDEAFREAFSDNIEGFEDRFDEYARTSLRVTAEAALIERQDVLADMLTAMHERDMRFRNVADFKRAVTDGQYRLRYSKGRVNWQTETDPSIYFSDIQGNPLAANALFFDFRTPGPLPDIVCRTRELSLRTRFYRLADAIEHEVLTERR